MNKLTKLGVSALCGSLATVSAVSAGEMTVTGSAHMTYTQLGHGETGNPLGMKTNLSFAGSGELDGGQTFSLTIDNTDKNVFSAGNIALTTNNLGTFNMNQAGGGGGVGGYDDNMPRAVEEVWDAGVATNINLQKGVGSSTNLQWESPRVVATTLRVAWTPENDGTQPNDKSVGGGTATDLNRGLDGLIRINPSFGAFGVDLFVGYSETDRSNDKTATGKQAEQLHREGVGGLTLDLGPISIGGQVSGEYNPTEAVATNEYYGTSSVGVAFNVNDDLSISYGEMRSIKGDSKGAHTGVGAQSPGVQGADDPNELAMTPKTEMTGESWQIAYTMGGIAFKYADTTVSNVKYTKGSSSEARLFIMSMAF